MACFRNFVFSRGGLLAATADDDPMPRPVPPNTPSQCSGTTMEQPQQQQQQQPPPPSPPRPAPSPQMPELRTETRQETATTQMPAVIVPSAETQQEESAAVVATIAWPTVQTLFHTQGAATSRQQPATVVVVPSAEQPPQETAAVTTTAWPQIPVFQTTTQEAMTTWRTFPPTVQTQGSAPIADDHHQRHHYEDGVVFVEDAGDERQRLRLAVATLQNERRNCTAANEKLSADIALQDLECRHWRDERNRMELEMFDLRNKLSESQAELASQRILVQVMEGRTEGDRVEMQRQADKIGRLKRERYESFQERVRKQAKVEDLYERMLALSEVENLRLREEASMAATVTAAIRHHNDINGGGGGGGGNGIENGRSSIRY